MTTLRGCFSSDSQALPRLACGSVDGDSRRGSLPGVSLMRAPRGSGRPGRTGEPVVRAARSGPELWHVRTADLTRQLRSTAMGAARDSFTNCAELRKPERRAAAALPQSTTREEERAPAAVKAALGEGAAGSGASAHPPHPGSASVLRTRTGPHSLHSAFLCIRQQ